MEKLDSFFQSKGYENFKDFQKHYIDNPSAYDLGALFVEYADYYANTKKIIGEKIEFKEGMTFDAVIPFSQPKASKVHIDYIMPSKAYSDEVFVMYRTFGKNKRWWHTFMCTVENMRFYIELAEKRKKKNGQ